MKIVLGPIITIIVVFGLGVFVGIVIEDIKNLYEDHQNYKRWNRMYRENGIGKKLENR